MSYADIATACLRRLPPETAHNAALALLGLGRLPAPPPPAPALAVTLWGLRFPTPVGLAAGFDKDVGCPDAGARLGLGFGEAGTVTPRPQPGNPRPRLFRLRRDRALINRYGFNSAGLDIAVERLERWRRANSAPRCPLGINIGVNKDSADPARDYADGLTRVAALADYVAVNVSSPNTPGLRAWQTGDALDRLLAALSDAHAPLDAPPPILLKFAPEIDDEALAALLDAIDGAPIAGLILTNTTTSRPPGLVSRERGEEGGLSGPPLGPRALEVLRRAYALSDGRLPLVGVGGNRFGGGDLRPNPRRRESHPDLHRAGLPRAAARQRDHAGARSAARGRRFRLHGGRCRRRSPRPRCARSRCVDDLPRDGQRRGERIGRLRDRAADNKRRRAGASRIGGRRDARLIGLAAVAAACRADAGDNDIEARPMLGAQRRNLVRARDHAGQPRLACQPGEAQHLTARRVADALAREFRLVEAGEHGHAEQARWGYALARGFFLPQPRAPPASWRARRRCEW